MAELNQEISTDYDADSQPVRDPNKPMINNDPVDPLAGCDQEQEECEALGQELDQFLKVTMALEDHGMSPTTFGLLKSGGYLAGTSLTSLGMEMFGNSGPQDPETMMATEALMEKIKEKAAAWSAKIINFVTSSTRELTELLTSLKDKILEKGQALISKAWDKAEAGGRVFNAHPYKTVFAITAAAIAIMAVIGFAAEPGTYRNIDTMRAYAIKLRDAVGKYIFPKGRATIEVTARTPVMKVNWSRDTNLITYDSYVLEYKTTAELGWTQTAVKSILGQFSKLWNSTKSLMSGLATPVVSAAKKIVNPVVSGAKKVNDLGGDMKDAVDNKVAEKTGSKLLGWAANKWVDKVYTTMLFSLIGVVYKLLKEVVLKAYRMVADTFSTLKAEGKPVTA